MTREITAELRKRRRQISVSISRYEAPTQVNGPHQTAMVLDTQ